MITLNEYLLSKDNQSKIINDPKREWSVDRIVNWIEVKGVNDVYGWDTKVYYPEVGKLNCTYGPCRENQPLTHWVMLRGNPNGSQQNVIIKPLAKWSKFNDINKKESEITFTKAIKGLLILPFFFETSLKF